LSQCEVEKHGRKKKWESLRGWEREASKEEVKKCLGGEVVEKKKENNSPQIRVKNLGGKIQATLKEAAENPEDQKEYSICEGMVVR